MYRAHIQGALISLPNQMLLRTDIGQGIRDTLSATPDNRVAKPLAMLTMERSVSWCVCDYVLSDYHAYTDDTLAPTKQYLLRTQGLKKSSSILYLAAFWF